MRAKEEEWQERGSRSQVREGKPTKDLGFSLRADKLTTQRTASCTHNEQSDISSLYQRAEQIQKLMGKRLQGMEAINSFRLLLDPWERSERCLHDQGSCSIIVLGPGV